MFNRKRKQVDLGRLCDDKERVTIGREHCSSDFGRRYMFRRSWVWIPALYTGWTFSHLFHVIFVWKDENKRKRGRGWAIKKKELQSAKQNLSDRSWVRIRRPEVRYTQRRKECMKGEIQLRFYYTKIQLVNMWLIPSFSKFWVGICRCADMALSLSVIM